MGKFVDFEGSNMTFKGDGETILDVRAFHNGQSAVLCFELDEIDIDSVNRTGKLFVAIKTDASIQPILIGSRETVRSCIVDYGPLWKG